MVFLSKFFTKILASVLIIGFLIVAPFSLFPKINELNYSFNNEIQLKFCGVLELWNVDTFEGGSISRATFLEKRAIEFEKKNKGVFISVNNITLNQLKLNLENGKTPHIITFGIGAGELIEKQLITLENNAVREDLKKSGVFDGRLKALPIMMGGYSLISLEENANLNSIVYSTNEYINPLLALFVNDIKSSDLCELNITSFEAYEKFINNKYKTLLGTQRDFYRCNNREEKNNLNYNYTLLSGFSDLIVYGGVFDSDSETEKVCELFLNYLTEEESQQKLANINMFPVLNKNIYTDEKYQEFNNILLKHTQTLNVFLTNSKLLELKTLLNEYFSGNEDVKKEISKFLI